MSPERLSDRIAGGLPGLALGDAFGAAHGADALPAAAIDDLEDVPRLRRAAERLFALSQTPA
ncbi:MAG: hypothetical protein JF600_13285 [Xanthomonadales bacterium]|nr:hypothetical protein [Xanthomonadales bacterium]